MRRCLGAPSFDRSLFPLAMPRLVPFRWHTCSLLRACAPPLFPCLPFSASPWWCATHALDPPRRLRARLVCVCEFRQRLWTDELAPICTIHAPSAPFYIQPMPHPVLLQSTVCGRQRALGPALGPRSGGTVRLALSVCLCVLCCGRSWQALRVYSIHCVGCVFCIVSWCFGFICICAISPQPRAARGAPPPK